MKSLSKKVFFFFFISIVLSIPLICSASNVYAAVADPNPMDVFSPSYSELEQEKKDMRKMAAENDQVYVSGLPVTERHIIDTIGIFTGLVGGCHDPEACRNQPSALGSVTQLIGVLYQYPPASGLAYTRHVLANAGILAKPAYAQGIGFAGLSPFLPLWETTRNIAYALIVIVMLIIGFMIIFRMKIDPKTIISLQAAIPNIVLTLILITFSYAIVGFLIDIMYLVMAIIINVFLTGMDQTDKMGQLQTDFMTGGVWQLAKYIFGGGFASVDDIGRALWGGIAGATGVATIIGKVFASLTLLNALAIGGGAIALIFLLILLLGLLFTFIRLLLLLLNSYLQLIIGLILGPLQLLTGAVPGRTAFTDWILNIIANLSVFPTTVAVIMFGTYLTAWVPRNTTSLWKPPFIGVAWTSDFNLFTALLGIGVIFTAPTLVASVKKMFRPKPMMPFSPGTLMAPLTGSFQTGMGAASQFYYAKSALESLGIGKKK